MKDEILFSPYRLWSFYKDAQRLYSGDMVAPRMISVWLTQYCNLKCSYCLFASVNKRDCVSTYKFKKFIDEIQGSSIESIEFSGGGEPLLHQDAYDIAEYIINAGLKVGVLTNGTILDCERLVKLFAYVRISLDAVDKYDYAKLKNPITSDVFDIVLNNVRELIKLRSSRNKPIIGIKFLISSLNYKQILRMSQLASSLGVDYVQFKPVHTTSNVLNIEQIIEAENMIAFCKSVGNNSMSIIGGVKQVKSNIKCFMSPIHTVIDALGNMYICCYIEGRDILIGNVFENGFHKLWWSRKHQNVINGLKVEECNKFDCRWHFYNTEMKEVLEKNKYTLSFI